MAILVTATSEEEFEERLKAVRTHNPATLKVKKCLVPPIIFKVMKMIVMEY